MDYLKQWTLCVCITLILAVILSLISPSGTMGKFYKTVISLFLIASFLLPLSDFDYKDFNFNFDFEESSVIESERIYVSQIENSVKSTLETGGYSSCSVNADVTLNGDEITIDSLLIAIPSKYNSDEVKGYILTELGFSAEVRYLGE